MKERTKVDSRFNFAKFLPKNLRFLAKIPQIRLISYHFRVFPGQKYIVSHKKKSKTENVGRMTDGIFPQTLTFVSILAQFLKQKILLFLFWMWARR